MLIDLRQAQFADLTPAPRYRDSAPSRGAVTGPGMAYLREHFHNPECCRRTPGTTADS